MRVYVSGPMTGIPDLNRPAFRAAEQSLRDAGYEVVSPVDNGLSDDQPWAEHLRADIRLLMDCEAIAMLPGWERSRGATLEVHVARALGFAEWELLP